jgi:hypothetical protein
MLDNKENKMKQEKNLKKVKVVKHWETGEKHYEDCGQVNIDFYGPCNCYKRMEQFKGWRIDDLRTCTMEATNWICDKRLMYKTRNRGDVDFHCTQGCAETWKREYC